MSPQAGRGWILFSAIGIPLWIGVMVLVGVLNDDPSDPGPTLVAFIAGGVIFFGLMFGAALWQQLRMRADSDEARFGKGVAVGYSVTGAVVTGLAMVRRYTTQGAKGRRRLEAGAAFPPLTQPVRMLAPGVMPELLVTFRHTA